MCSLDRLWPRVSGESVARMRSRPLAALEDRAESPTVRGEALMALAALRAESAVQRIRTVLAESDRPQRRWTPPSPESFLDLVGARVDEEARNAALDQEDLEEWRRLGRGAECAEAPLPGGGRLLVFPDGALGSARDLWAVERDRTGALADPAVFLGPVLPGGACHDCRVSVRLHKNILHIERTDESASPTEVDLAEISRDRDGDGLSDLVEKRLTTDPNRPDTDGDGLGDAEDPQPDVAPNAPATEEQEIAEAIFHQYFLFKRIEDRQGLIVMQSSVPLRWRGRLGPTLTPDIHAQEGFKERTGADRVYYYSIRPAEEEEPKSGWGEVRIETGDRLYRLSYYCSPLCAGDYYVGVRRLGPLWLIRQVVLESIS